LVKLFKCQESLVGQAQTLLLGLIAGATIVLGLPFGRLRTPSVNTRVFLNATAIGVLVFLGWDVLTHAWEPVDSALAAMHDGTGGLSPVIGYGGLFLGGIAVGLCSLLAYEQWMARRYSSDALALRSSSSGPVRCWQPGVRGRDGRPLADWRC
jgi:ZIP family zinc transporter